MAQVLAIKPGRLKAGDRKKLAAADIIVLELDDPTDLRMVQVEGSELACSELSWAALASVDEGGIAATHHHFVRNVRALVTKKLQRRSEQSALKGESE